jgi:hypothetical protein
MAQGFAPLNGFELIEGRWLNGIVNGVNFTPVAGVIAMGTTQATAAAIPPGNFLVSVDVSTAGTGLGGSLPFAIAGTSLMLYNNTANVITIYPSVANNPKTAAQDTINNAASMTVAAHTAEIFFSPKTGIWAAK